MPDANFTKDFDYRVKPDSAAGSIVAYQKGWSGSIPQAHLAAAIEAGAVEGSAEKPPAANVKPAAKEAGNAGGGATL